MKSSAREVKLASVDDLFTTEENRQDAAREKVMEIPLGELFPFPDHPFSVRDDDTMKETVESVKEYGVLMPAIARPREGGGYELVSGHRRKRACELAGLETMPVIVRDLDRDTAIIYMVDSNIQRENISPIERGKAFKMKMEAVRRRAGRPAKAAEENSPQVAANFRCDDEVARDFKYEMEDVDCKFCTEYRGKKLGCSQKVCPWLAERIEAGAVGYEEALLDSFPHDPKLEAKLHTAVRLFRGSMWLDEGHRQRMQALRAREGSDRRRDTPAYIAAMYLLTSDQDTATRTANCFYRDGIMFSYATTKGISPHGYTLLGAARDIYANGDGIALNDLADSEVVDSTAFCLIVNALLIARYGIAALDIQKKQAQEQE